MMFDALIIQQFCFSQIKVGILHLNDQVMWLAELYNNLAVLKISSNQ